MTRPPSPVVVATLCASIACAVAAPARADYIDHLHALDDVGRMKVPRRGSPRILVVPVLFADQGFEDGVRDEEEFLIEARAFFEGGPPVDGGRPQPFTFPGYFDALSLGQYTPTAVVADPVRFPTCPRLGDYEGCEIPRGGGLQSGDVIGAARLLRDALFFFDEIMRCAFVGPNPEARCTSGGGVDPRDFDALGPQGEPDSFLDGVVIVSNSPFPGIALPVKDLSEHPLLTSAGPLPSFVYDGVTVGAVAVSGREAGDQRGAWVAVHEHGHLLGFADLYNEDGTTTDLPYTLMGGWYYDEPPSLLDAFSRAVIGWGHVQQVTGPGTYLLLPSWSTGHVLKVGTGSEFFLIEHRVKRDDVDADLGVPFGVAIFRVRLDRWPDPEPGGYLNTLANCVNCTPFDALVMLEEADGAYDLQRNRPRDDEDDLFQEGDALAPSDDTARRSLEHPVSSTNLLSGRPTDITIRVVAVNEDGATLEIDAPTLQDGCAHLQDLCREHACEDASCGPPLPPEEPPPVDPPGCAGCGGPSAAMLLAPILAALRRRRASRSPHGPPSAA